LLARVRVMFWARRGLGCWDKGVCGDPAIKGSKLKTGTVFEATSKVFGLQGMVAIILRVLE